VHLCTGLVQAATCASRKKGSYFKERFWRLKARRGHKRAAMAVAHSILNAIYELLREPQDFRDLGAGHLDRLTQRTTEKRLVRRLEALGYKVTLAAACSHDRTCFRGRPERPSPGGARQARRRTGRARRCRARRPAHRFALRGKDDAPTVRSSTTGSPRSWIRTRNGNAAPGHVAQARCPAASDP
jgi:hypothetical protein